MNAIINETKEVIKNNPTNPRHMVSRDVIVATANTSPTTASVSEFTAGTPTTKRLL